MFRNFVKIFRSFWDSIVIKCLEWKYKDQLSVMENLNFSDDMIDINFSNTWEETEKELKEQLGEENHEAGNSTRIR